MLHCFQKKSPSGVRTAKTDVDLIEKRLKAAARLSINQPKISALKHYRLEGFSVERLMGFLTALGSDIEIRIPPPKKTPGQIRVEAA